MIRISVLALSLLLLAGCSYFPSRSITGSGVIARVVPPASASFTAVDVGHAFDVHIAQGPVREVVIEVDDNLTELLVATIRDGTLVIDLAPGSYTNTTLKARITMPEIDALAMSGAATGTVLGFEGRDLDLALSGASTLTIDMNADEVQLALSGASTLDGTLSAGVVRVGLSGASVLRIQGSAERIELEASGASRAALGSFAVVDAIGDASGASNIDFDVSGSVDLEASGASSITYSSGAQVRRAESSGMSAINPRK